MQFEKTNINSDIDPYFQHLIERQNRGVSLRATASTETGEVAVIAKVADLEAWKSLSDVRSGAEIGKTPDGHYLVTARIPVDRLEQVRRTPFVISLKPGTPLKPTLKATVEEIHSRLDLLPPTQKGNQGEGVIVGIVDYGCDFAHPSFRKADFSTRLLAIWNQGGAPNSDSPFGYGREYSQAEINQALQNPEPHMRLGYDVPRSSHGTHVMDIAAGNSGVAPKADLIFVEIRAKEPTEPTEILQWNFGNSVQLIEAIRYIFDKAGDRPCVVNFSLGTNGGPHDGSNLVEQAIDIMLSQQPNRAAVIAAGNAYEDGIHAAGNVPQAGFVDLQWELKEFDFTGNELEVWYKAGDQFRLEVISPDGASVASLDQGENGTLSSDHGNPLMFLAHRKQDPNNGDNVIDIFIYPTEAPRGKWTIRLHGLQITDGAFHAWIERDDIGQTRFVPPHDNAYTLGSLSCGHKTIAVGSYDAHKSDTPLSSFSSAGPTRDGRQKPEISAPGQDVIAAQSRSINGVTRKSGTSMAAPAVTGTIALILAEAKAKGVHLTIDQIRDLLSKTARKTSPDHTNDWHPRFGQGRVDAAACVSLVQPQSEHTVKQYQSTPDRSITDADPKGIQDVIQVSDSGQIVTLRVSVDISHTYIGDLRVQITAPNGKTVILHDRQGGTTDNLKQTYSVPSLKDTEIEGTWTLMVQDLANVDVGVLHHWALEMEMA